MSATTSGYSSVSLATSELKSSSFSRTALARAPGERDETEHDGLFGGLGGDETRGAKRLGASEGENSPGRGRKKPARDAREARDAFWAEWSADESL